MNDPKIEYLESVHAKNAAIDLLLHGADMVRQGGVEGIVEVANAYPELLLHTIDVLCNLIKEMRDDANAVLEDRLELSDQIEELTKNRS